MNGDDSERHSGTDADLDQEIRQGRKFTPQEALARLAGPGAMKGASPISQVQQGETEIGNWLKRHLPDPSGSLQILLHRNLRGSELLLHSLERPLTALAEYCQRVLASEYLLADLVREADAEWGRRMEERPYFDRSGVPQHPNDPYTVNSVRGALSEVVNQLNASDG